MGQCWSSIFSKRRGTTGTRSNNETSGKRRFLPRSETARSDGGLLLDESSGGPRCFIHPTEEECGKESPIFRGKKNKSTFTQSKCQYRHYDGNPLNGGKRRIGPRIPNLFALSRKRQQQQQQQHQQHDDCHIEMNDIVSAHHQRPTHEDIAIANRLQQIQQHHQQQQQLQRRQQQQPQQQHHHVEYQRRKNSGMKLRRMVGVRNAFSSPLRRAKGAYRNLRAEKGHFRTLDAGKLHSSSSSSSKCCCEKCPRGSPRIRLTDKKTSSASSIDLEWENDDTIYAYVDCPTEMENVPSISVNSCSHFHGSKASSQASIPQLDWDEQADVTADLVSLNELPLDEDEEVKVETEQLISQIDHLTCKALEETNQWNDVINAGNNTKSTASTNNTNTATTTTTTAGQNDNNENVNNNLWPATA